MATAGDGISDTAADGSGDVMEEPMGRYCVPNTMPMAGGGGMWLVAAGGRDVGMFRFWVPSIALNCGAMTAVLGHAGRAPAVALPVLSDSIAAIFPLALAGEGPCRGDATFLALAGTT